MLEIEKLANRINENQKQNRTENIILFILILFVFFVWQVNNFRKVKCDIFIICNYNFKTANIANFYKPQNLLHGFANPERIATLGDSQNFRHFISANPSRLTHCFYNIFQIHFIIPPFFIITQNVNLSIFIKFN